MGSGFIQGTIMSKLLYIVSLLVIAITLGCKSKIGSPGSYMGRTMTINVNVDSAGVLRAGNFTLSKSNLPQYIEETKGRRIIIFASNVIDFDRALEAKKALEDAGAKDVGIVNISE